MKLTASEVRARAKAIARSVSGIDNEAEAIIKLVEDATGEKLPEPFDESRVTHGSLWESRRGYHYIVISNSANHAIDKPLWSLVEVGTDYQYIAVTKRSHADICTELRDHTHIGQYDFAAGIPKGGAR